MTKTIPTIIKDFTYQDNDQTLLELLQTLDAAGVGGGGGDGTSWGEITGTLSAQADLQSALDAKVASSGLSETIDDRVANLLVAGSNVTITYNDASNTLTIASTGGGGGSTSWPTITTFVPTDKYSPLKMTEDDGWANGQPDNGTPATHDASAGAAPSFTTAKKKQICIVTVAGTLGGKTLLKGDLLMALQDNPTTAAHWAIITDCTSEFNTAVTNAQGDDLYLFGTFLLNSTTLNVPITLKGEYTILNRCGYAGIYTAGNNTRAASITPRQCASAGLGVGQGLDVDDELGSKLQQVTFFNLSTAAHAVDFPVGKWVEVFTDAQHPSESGTAISNAFIVTSVDTVSGIVYADRVIKYHNNIANASNIYLIPLHDDRAVNIGEGALFMGAPSIIGNAVGWWLTLDGTTSLSGSLSGSGEVNRTLTVSAGVTDTYVVNQHIRVGTVDGTWTHTAKITAKTSTTFTLEFETSGGLMVNDRGAQVTLPTSGALFFVPAFLTSDFDSTTHGGALILQQAHGSTVKCRVAKLWGMGVRVRFSHFCDTDVYSSKVVNIGTGLSGKSWRLIYIVETYSACRNRVKVRGCGGRHAYTSSSGTSSVTWATDHWQFRRGCTCENVADIATTGDTGAACDTHNMTNGDQITSEVEFVTTYNTGHSYRGIGGQLRGENHKIYHKQRGGQIGLRIANGSSYRRLEGCVDELYLDVSDLPMRDDGLAFGTNLPCGFIAQSQSGYTGGANGGRTMFIGEFNFKNAGGGAVLESYTKGRLEHLNHSEVGFCGAFIQDQASLYAAEVHLDYSLPNGVVTTSVSSNSVGSGSKTFTVASGLGIVAGQNVLVQDNSSVANSRVNYGWGRVVSYSSTTLVVSLDGAKGTGTLTNWVITTGTLNPRYGIVLKGAATFTCDIMKWRVGEGNNPAEIFHSQDNTGGKVVNVGILIVDDPLNKGLPARFTSGRSADFTMNIGMIIYNGKVVSGVGTGLVDVTIGDGSGVPSTGSKGFITIPYDCTISKWYLAANASGSCVVDVKRGGTSIVGGSGNKPTLSGAQSGNAAPASWTSVAVAKGDILEFNLDSVATITRVNLVLEMQKL